jgi:hypothetical protein
MAWSVAQRWLGGRGGVRPWRLPSERGGTLPTELCLGGFAPPHCGQRRARGVAHSMQNFIRSGLSASQRGQRMGEPSGTAMQAAGVWMGRGPNARP